MILLDTNVVSEPMRQRPDRRVQDWLDAQAIETLYLSTISLSELLLGIETLPAGRRRRALAGSLGERIAGLFGDRIIAFDVAAAEAYGRVVVSARRHGHATVASRDETPLQAAGMVVINPWTAEQ